MPLSTVDTDDTRRYAGYPVSAALQFADVETQGASSQVDIVLASLTDDQISILQNSYLEPLRILEAAIPAAGDNLDTDQAAVWTHNRTEVADRSSLFALLRLQMTYFLGIPAGSGITIGVSTGSGGLVLPVPPAVFTV